MNIVIVVYAQNEATFLKVKSHHEYIGITEKIIWCNAENTERSQIINKNLNSWLLFIDHDCELSVENMIFIKFFLLKYSTCDNTVYAGLYANSKESSYLQRVHNFIANNWLLQSYEGCKSESMILGGVFLVKANVKISHHKDGLFWGAEDKALSYELTQSGFELNLLKELKVIHKTAKTWKHFFKRAYVHGKNDINYINNDKNKINYLFWIRKIGFANLNLLPLVVCHFCIQRWAELVQTVRR
jgi:GT2 family glycosyltransferase